MTSETCPTCHGLGYELDSTGDAVPCGLCHGEDPCPWCGEVGGTAWGLEVCPLCSRPPEDWSWGEETRARVAAGAYPF